MPVHQGEQLDLFLRTNKLNRGEFADRIGISRGTLYNLLKSKNIEQEYLDSIKKAGYNFLTNVYSEEMNERKGNITFVPLHAYGGFLRGYESKVFTDQLQHFTLPGILGEHYAFEVDGFSMHDFASPGDWAISRPEEKLDFMIKGKPYVLQTTDGLLIKYFDKRDDGTGYFSSHNKEDYPQIKIPLKSIKRVYFVTRILKKI